MLYVARCVLYDFSCMLYAVWCMLYDVCCMLYAVCCMLNHRSHITYRRGAGGGDALPARGHVHGVGLGRLLPGPCLHFPLCPFPFRLSASPPSTPPPSAPASFAAPKGMHVCDMECMISDIGCMTSDLICMTCLMLMHLRDTGCMTSCVI